MKSNRVPAPVPLDSLDHIVAAWRVLNATPLKGAEKVPTLSLGAKILPDAAAVRAELEQVYPTLRGVRDRLRALALAVELLPDAGRPRSFGEQVLLAMADDDG